MFPPDTWSEAVVVRRAGDVLSWNVIGKEFCAADKRVINPLRFGA